MPHSEPRPPVPAGDQFVILAIISEAALAFLALLIGWWFEFSPTRQLHFGTDRATIQALGLGVAATVPLVGALLLMDRWSWGPLRQLRQVVLQRVVPLFSRCTTAQLAVISLFAGVGEELLFRGLLQAGVAQWLGGVSGAVVGIGISNLLFGICHSITRGYALMATLVGVYFGLLFLVTGSLLVPIVAHAGYDFFALQYWLHRASGTTALFDEDAPPEDRL